MAKKMGTGMKVGAGVAAVSALALGAYLLYGKNGDKNRKKVKAWMLKAKGEILEQLENVKDMSVDSYHDLVDKIVSKYSAKSDMTKADIGALVSELKSYAGRFTGKKTTSRTAPRKTAKKPMKRSTKGATKKARK